MILGLDISTTTTGLTILDSNGIIIHTEAIITKTEDFSHIFLKAEKVIERLQFVNSNFKIEKIFIEEPSKMFATGKSSADVISMLQQYNGIISWNCYSIFNILPEYFVASSARKMNGITIKKGAKAKKIVLKHLLDNEPGFSVEYTRNGNPKSYFYDIADSIVIAKAGYISCLKRN